MLMKIEYRQGRDPCVKFNVGSERFIGYFPKNIVLPGNPSELEVMFTGVLHPKDEDNRYVFDKIKCVFVSPPLPGDIHFTTKGFECSGSMCSTTAIGEMTDPALWEKWGKGNITKTITVTPGAVGAVEVSNVNVGWNGQERKPLIPVSGWARKFPDKAFHRLVGVDDWKYLDYFYRLLKKNSPPPFEPCRQIRPSGMWYENDWIQYEDNLRKVVTYMDVRRHNKQKAPPYPEDLERCQVDVQEYKGVA